MKRLVFAVSALFICLTISALEIPKGTFYFDNSLTNYSQVKFVYGSDTRTETYVRSMTRADGNQWKITFDASVGDLYRYTFAETSLPDGRIDSIFSDVKNHISNTLGEKRTATTDAAMIPSGIFVPSSSDNWAQGEWQTFGETTYSGTLPVLFINTDGGAEITSKETYVSATYYLDNLGLAGYESIGSADSPLTLEIRGRGNYTWSGFDKKPYRLKLTEKQPLMGMNSSKHFVLLAHADDELAFLRNTVGFELSRRLGMAWTPEQRPVEVVLNGDYIGLYMLTENIRVAKKRVNITEQNDLATDAEEITGGWIIEIDNYDTDPHVTITEGNGNTIWFTYKSPETLSTAQSDYLTAQMNAINSAIYESDKSSTTWESLVDLDELVRFYLVQEILDNAESFHGSCYMHKQRGTDEKWFFGPVWDFGNTFRRLYSGSTNQFCYLDPPYGQSWIEEMAKFPNFQTKVREIWLQFKGSQYGSLTTFIDDFCDQIASAAVADYKRWPTYGTVDVVSKKAEFKNLLNQRVSWLIEQWGDASALQTVENEPIATLFSTEKGEFQIAGEQPVARLEIFDTVGQLVAQYSNVSGAIACPSGLYIVRMTGENGATSAQKILVK